MTIFCATKQKDVAVAALLGAARQRHAIATAMPRRSGAVLIALAALELASCASTSPVVAIGNGAYEVAGTAATAFSSGGEEKVGLLTVATKYCGARGEKMKLITASDQSAHMGAFASVGGPAFHGMAVRPARKASADVVFKCE